MYIGIVTVPEKRYEDRWNKDYTIHYSVCLGIVPVTKHAYTCDACGYRYAFEDKADEEFYCRCNALINVNVKDL